MMRIFVWVVASSMKLKPSAINRSFRKNIEATKAIATQHSKQQDQLTSIDKNR